MKGYAGKILRLDLSRGKVWSEDLSEEVCGAYLGGKGFGIKFLYSETIPMLDPLSPESIIAFAVGPLNASLLPGANRLGAFFKSPLTGIWGESYCGGYIGTEIKRAGFDVLIVSGKTEKPVYLLIDGEKVELRSAEHLWGKDTFETQDIIVKDHGRFQIAAIGPAGENLVRYACVDHDKGRQFGRCG